jgi:ribosome maturation factor RimP
VAIVERVSDLIEDLLASQGVEIVDLEYAGGSLRLTIDQEGGVDLSVIAEVTRTVSRALDDADPIPAHYTLEVSSPGLERNLRTPGHYQRAVGTAVAVKTYAEVDGQRRLTGELVAADDAGIVVRPEDGTPDRALTYDQIERARTVFVWGPGPKPGKAPREANRKTGKAKSDNDKTDKDKKAS